MNTVVIAKDENTEDIVKLRVEMQIEDWSKTLNKDFSAYAEKFAVITGNHIIPRLNKSLYLGFKKISSKYFLNIE